MKQNKYIFVPRERINEDFDPNSRLYIGSHTCVHHLPSVQQIENVKECPLTLVVPPVPQDKFSNIQKYIEQFISISNKPEIVFNDWGVFDWFCKQNQWEDVPKIIGFLLIYQKRDPYFSLFKEDFRTNVFAEDNPLWFEFAKENQISAIEITSTIQNYEMRHIQDTDVELHTYTPFSYLTFTRYCPPLMMKKNKVHNALPMDCDILSCSEDYYELERLVEGEKVKHFYIGNAQYYQNLKIISGADRVIDNQFLIKKECSQNSSILGRTKKSCSRVS